MEDESRNNETGTKRPSETRLNANRAVGLDRRDGRASTLLIDVGTESWHNRKKLSHFRETHGQGTTPERPCRLGVGTASLHSITREGIK